MIYCNAFFVIIIPLFCLWYSFLSLMYTYGIYLQFDIWKYKILHFNICLHWQNSTIYKSDIEYVMKSCGTLAQP